MEKASQNLKPDRSWATTILPGPVWLTIALAAFVFVYVNPFREMEVDDDWAYALTVRHLLDTGHYRLNDWATANMPFQVYWGALFARFGGYSHSNLRLSTLVLWAMALVAFYFLCREHGFDRQEAGLLVLGLFSCPLTIKMSFSFMTDVPYLSCLIIALYLYTRAVRLRRYDLMFSASLAASAAILTRQFGIVLIGGMVLLWAATENRVRNVALFTTGLAWPLVALGWQLRMGLAAPTWATRFNFSELIQYYSDPQGLAASVVWRSVMILEYIAFFVLPFALLPAMEAWRKNHGRQLAVRSWLLPALIFSYMMGVLVCSHRFKAHPSLMPLLEWNFKALTNHGRAPRLLLTALTTLGGSLAASCFLYRDRIDWPQLSPHERLLDFVTGGIILISLAFWAIGDEYLLPFLPYALIALGRRCKPLLQEYGRWIAAFCLLITLVSAVYTRGILARTEAFWKGGEIARNLAAPQQTVSSDWTWTSYYYFAAFVAHLPASTDLSVYFDWLHKHAEGAAYIVGPPPFANSPWKVVASVSYRPYPFVERNVYVLKKSP